MLIMKKISGWTLAWLIVIILMFILGMTGIIWEETDWIFLVLVVGIIMLNQKLDKIIGILSKKKK